MKIGKLSEIRNGNFALFCRLFFYAFVFAILIYFLIFPKNSNDSSYVFRNKAFYDYYNVSDHLALSEYYQSINNLSRAKQELIIALRISKSSLQFGDRFFSVWLEEQKPVETQREIAFWEDYLAKKPNYRDGWIQLAVLYYRIYQDTKATHALRVAIELDPNYSRAREIWLYLP